MIEHVINKNSRDLGGGFEVCRMLPSVDRQMIGPFIFFDHFGPFELSPGIPRDADVRPHPHIGLSTISYLFSGAVTHRDSLGYKQEIRMGEVNWMVAGKGITHSERFEYARVHGANMHGIQAWVALPNESEEVAPSFFHYEGLDLPEFNEGGVKGRVIAGDIEGMHSKVQTHSPLFYMHWEMAAGSQRSIEPSYSERGVYIVSGEVEVGGNRFHSGQMIVLAKGHTVELVAPQLSTVMLLGGEPVGKRYIFWNFVSSSKERIEQAKVDWKHGRMDLPVGDDQEFIPLPD